MVCHVDAFEAIREVEIKRNNRLDTSRNFIPTPETNKQVQFVQKMLGLHPEHVLQDRSDRKWLKRVHDERKKKK
jgi:hypothetical protein